MDRSQQPDREMPDPPHDLLHPGRLAWEQPASQPAPAGGLDDSPIFDDPIIGWWESAWDVQEATAHRDEPLI